MTDIVCLPIIITPLVEKQKQSLGQISVEQAESVAICINYVYSGMISNKLDAKRSNKLNKEKNKRDGYRQQNVRQRQKFISIRPIDYHVCILENLQLFSYSYSYKI